MTQRPDPRNEHGDATPLPDDLLAARDRVAEGRAKARRALGRGRARRRLLPQIAAISAVIVTLGAADRFVQGVSTHTASVSAASIATGPPSSTARALAQVSKTLAADQRVIAALAIEQARLVQGASGGDGGGSVGSSSQLQSLPSLGSIPSISIPAVSAPPVVATTGASVVIP
jgi:hypothetical protein